MDCSPISVETVQRQLGLAIGAVFVIFERQDVA